VTNTIDSEFEELCLKIGSAYGLDELSSKLFALLYLEPNELSLEELAEKSGYSLSTVSKGLSRFEHVSLFKKYRKPKSKKIYCALEKNFEKLTVSMMHRLVHEKIIPFKEKVPKLIEKYDTQNANDLTKQKILILKNALKQTKKCETAICTMLKYMGE